MTVDEIYGALASHMVEGMMVHENMANYYDFLGLKGYRKCHEERFIDETMNYRQLCKYYISHHNKLIPRVVFKADETIPLNWFNHVRQDVDNKTRQTAVKDGLMKWHEWEKETKQMYERAYTNLMDIGEVASALFVSSFVKDVDKELKRVEQYLLEKSSTEFGMREIIDEQ